VFDHPVTQCADAAFAFAGTRRHRRRGTNAAAYRTATWTGCRRRVHARSAPLRSPAIRRRRALEASDHFRLVARPRPPADTRSIT
jgi:hypothetical protein